MKGIKVRWSRRPWNRASPSNPTIRKYSIEMVADIHTEVRQCTVMLYPHTLTNSQEYASLQCANHNHLNAVFPGRLFHGLRGHLTWIPFIISMGIFKFTCVWDPSRNGHGISCQNCSCLRYYSKHNRDICQGSAESFTSMSFLHWGWWPSIWATVVRCKIMC